MQTLEETREKYKAARGALAEAKELVTQLEELIDHICYGNEEPIPLPRAGKETHYDIYTPAGLDSFPTGTLIQIGGREYMYALAMPGGPRWVDALGEECTVECLYARLLQREGGASVIHYGN